MARALGALWTDARPDWKYAKRIFKKSSIEEGQAPQGM
jgi:hypothetical protein